MNDLAIPQGLDDVDTAIFLVQVSDRAVSATRALLFKIFSEKTWQGRFSTWGEFVEEGLGKSQGWASKQLTVHEHFTLKGGIPTEDLNIDTEKLYMAARLEGSTEEQIEKARTLSRYELKQERNDEAPHEHVPICAICRVRL
jgi:hypothetical protein